jgi:hypothetical protein
MRAVVTFLIGLGVMALAGVGAGALVQSVRGLGLDAAPTAAIGVFLLTGAALLLRVWWKR